MFELFASITVPGVKITVSSFSSALSARTATVNVLEVCPAANVKVPEAAV